MKTDVLITNPGQGASPNPDYLRELRDWADEDKRCPVSEAEQQLDAARFAKVMRMTARQFAKLEEAERRNYTRWARHFARVFAEKAALFERNTRPEPELPAFLVRIDR